MLENWEQYKDLEYYPDRFCACSCGGRIKVEPHHKYYGIPKIIRGHNGGWNKLPREIRVCGRPNCNTSFEVSIHSTQKYCSTGCQLEAAHNGAKRPPSKETCKKIADSTSRCYMEGRRSFQPCYKSGYVFLGKLGLFLFFRSSYEERALLFLGDLNDIADIKTEAIRIEYENEEGYTHFYLPDILVKDMLGNSYLIEVKPSHQLEDKVNQLKFKAGIKYSLEHGIAFLIWTEEFVFSNNNGSTTASLQEIAKATAATLSESGKVMIQSELYRNVQKQAEMACSPSLVN